MKKIIFLDKERKREIGYNIGDVPLNNKKIVEKCIQYFGDDDPCIIHKNFISKKMIIEIDELISKKDVQKEFCYELKNSKILDLYLDIAKEYTLFKVIEI